MTIQKDLITILHEVDRLKIIASLFKKELNDFDDNNFVELLLQWQIKKQENYNRL